MRISVFESRELQALLLALRGFDRELKKIIRQQTKAVAQSEWQKAVTERASTRVEHRLLAQPARAQVSDQNVTLRSAHIGRSLSGGLSPSAGVGGAEFGSTHKRMTAYTARSKTGKTFTVTRHTTRQFQARKPSGRVVYPAAARMIPRLAALWVQTTVRLFHETIERKS